ncbi:galectin-3-like [Dendropsophus ebraccatus]|uniref:galectin-3-like n=1 Tax=Dendropsophus ebraccatus TaxID=150705 RepID=UPI003832308D
MSEFSLDDALSGQANASTVKADQGNQGQNYNPWGGQNPGQQGFPGQPFPGFPAPGQGQGQQNPGYPAPGQGPQYPGYPAPGQGPQYPGFPPGGQQYPGFPPAAGQQYPGYPGFPGPGQPYPGAPTPGAPTPGQGPSVPKQTVPNVPSGPQKVPCDIPLPAGCVAGMCFELEGTPTGKGFGVDYKIGNDIALHVNPRFHEHPHVLVRNSCVGGKWGPEERQCPKFPFQQGKPFKLQIHFQPDCYRVAVNNENLFQYKHRLTNFAGIKCIRIQGDLTISGVRVTMV